MRIEATSSAEHLGSVRIHGVRRVLELDSGTSATTHLDEVLEAQTIGVSDIEDVQQRLAIVLPIKDEDLKVFAGTLAGIPHNCLIIVVSNSQRMETDAFRSEQNILSHFCYSTTSF
jgi:mannosyl-3-phosphoglycerate synthase